MYKGQISNRLEMFINKHTIREYWYYPEDGPGHTNTYAGPDWAMNLDFLQDVGPKEYMDTIEMINIMENGELQSDNSIE